MLGSSSRVKLNRVALKELKVEQPRRRRLHKSLSDVKEGKQEVVSELVSVNVPSSHEPGQTSLTGPENVTDATEGELEEEKGVEGPQKKKAEKKRRNSYQDVKHGEGPFTRGKYQQSKPNTRSKGSLHHGGIRRLCDLRLKFTWCFCTASDRRPQVNHSTQVRRRRGVKLKSTVSKMACQMELNSKAIKSLKSSVGKSSVGCIKTRVTRVVNKTGRDRKSKVKARSTGCEPHGDPQPAAANTGQVHTGTRSTATGLSNIDRNTHPNPTGLAGSDGSLRRAVRASGCGLCGDCKCISPQQKRLREQRQKCSSPGPEQPTVEVRSKKENAVTETSKKIIIWINQFPQVTLCDIAQKCDALRHDCGYVLPDVLKSKVVHCFKQEMRAGFLYRPGCFDHGQSESEESALAENKEICPTVQFEPSQSLTERQRHLKEHTDVQTFSTHATCRFLNSWTSEGSATCSASFLLGERTNTGECRTGMLDRAVEENPGPVSSVAIHRDKRIKLGDDVKDGILPSTPDLESISCKDPAKIDSCDKEKRTSDDSQSCLEHAVRGSSSFDLDVKENCVNKEIDNPQNPTKTDAAQMSSDLNCERNEVDTDELESFTCQRVRAYFRKIKFSCARTYMSWPFSNSSWKLTAHAGTTGCPAEPIDPSARDNPPLNHKQPGSTNYMLPDTHTSGITHQVSHQNKEKREEKGERVLVDINGKTHGNISMEFAPHFMEAEESLASLSSDTATLSNPSQRGGKPGNDTVSPSSSPVNGPESDRSTSTPSPSALGLSNWETSTLSPMPSPFTRGGLSSLSAMPFSLPPSSFLLKKVECAEVADSASASSSSKCVVKVVEKTLFCCEETQMSPWTSSSAPPHNSDSFDSSVSSLLFPQGEQESDEGLFAGRTPPKLEPYYNTSPFNHVVVKLRNILTEKCVEMDLNEFMLPPMLSPVASPQGRSRISLQPQSPDEEEKEEIYTRKHKMSPGCHMPQIVNGDNENAKDYLEHEELKVAKTTNEDDGTEKENQDEIDHEDDVEQGNKTSEVPSDPKIKATLTSGALTEPCSSPSSDEDDGGVFSDEGSSPSEIAGSERKETYAEAAGDAQRSILDEFTAYEKDILLVDVIQEDPELFENLPQGSLLKLGPTRVTEAPKIRPIGEVKTLSPRTNGASLEFKQRLTSVKIGFPWDSPDADIKEESNSRSWRPHCSSSSSSTPSKMQSNTWPATEKQTKNMGQPDANNNHVNGVLERSQPIQTVNSLHKHISPLISIRNGLLVTNPENVTDFRRQKSNTPQYCRQYFSESLSCGFKMCRFQHVPVEGDEKLCVETVTRFTKNPMCLQKAGAVFTGYYQNNPPGAYFSMPVLLCLLWALLKAGMVSDVFSVLSVSLSHKIVPGHEFLLALFNIVREKGLMGVVPELMQLTFKMASAGLVLSLDCLDCVKNTPEFQETVNPNSHVSVSGNHKLSTSAPFPEYLNLAHSIVEIELCTKQEDWRRMGEVFRSICQSSQHPNQVGRISGRIAIALLSESKDKLSLPFAAFAETVCQNDDEENLIRSFLGRIGVSLMLRYHKTHQWGKGRRVVEVLSSSKVNYSTLKGLFGNEDGSSRCHLVTVATELFLLSCSLEGALNTLRENKWFLSSRSWPCEPADLESRTRVLMRLAEKTSHRDTLEVLCNLPGLKEPNDVVDVSRYGPLFNSHLRVCVDRHILPVASDTVDFMLSKKLSVDQALLQMLLHKLGKQNLWLRAREVFRHSLSTGYYPGVSAPPGFMELIVPCQLGEVEVALTLEMFITVNATDIFHLSENTKSCLRITLKRTQSCESEYLSAGSRILSAACIPQPKLIIHYTAVNSSQDQVFTLDVPSARCWLRHNHLWANEVWTH